MRLTMRRLYEDETADRESDEEVDDDADAEKLLKLDKSRQ